MDIRKLLGTGRLVLGTERTLKALKDGSLEQVVLASNCSKETRAAVEKAAGKAEVVTDSRNNEELGILCKKPFRIVVLGVKHG